MRKISVEVLGELLLLRERQLIRLQRLYKNNPKLFRLLLTTVETENTFDVLQYYFSIFETAQRIEWADFAVHENISVEECEDINSVFCSKYFSLLKDKFSADEHVCFKKMVRAYNKRYEYEKYKQTMYYRYFLARKTTTSKTIRKKVFMRNNHMCVHCGTTDKLTIDHIIPVSKYGLDTLCNLQTLCRSCNSSKGNRIQK